MDFNKLKVPELKAKLKELGLPVGGRKADLVERLEQHDAQAGGADNTEAETAAPESPDAGADERTEAEPATVAEEAPAVDLKDAVEQTVAEPPPEVKAPEVSEDAAVPDDISAPEGGHAGTELKAAVAEAEAEVPDREPDHKPQFDAAQVVPDAAVAEAAAEEQRAEAAEAPAADEQVAAGEHTVAKAEVKPAAPAVSSDDALSMGSDEDDAEQQIKAAVDSTAAPAAPQPASEGATKPSPRSASADRAAPGDAAAKSRGSKAPIAFPNESPAADVAKERQQRDINANGRQPREGAAPTPAAHSGSGAASLGRTPSAEASQLPRQRSTESQGATTKRKRSAIVFDPAVASDERGEGQAARKAQRAAPPAKAREIDVGVPDGATRALRIDGFRRPLQEPRLKELLGQTGCGFAP